ncbi:Retrotransposon gag domain [Sesbania bispinosa]|nr:Retrotransposon gag domain [Sesbania bispinosa]
MSLIRLDAGKQQQYYATSGLVVGYALCSSLLAITKFNYPTVLTSIIANQESLANLVSDLRTQVRANDDNTKKGDRGSPNALFELEPPLTEEVQVIPYPTSYHPPSFKKFDGTGSVREHLMCFLDDLGVHRDNKALWLKEFSKSLAGRAFTWYAKLRPKSIRTWDELVMEFCGKFLEEEGTIQIMDLGRVKHRTGESLVAFMKRYRDCALQSDVAKAMKRQGKQAKESDKAVDDTISFHHKLLDSEEMISMTTQSREVRSSEIQMEEMKEEADHEERALVAGLANIRGFRNLFSQLDLDQDAQKEAARALIRIVKENDEELCATNAPLTRLAGSHALIYRSAGRRDKGQAHVGVSDITLNTFHGEPLESRGCVNVMLEVGPIKMVNVFQVVDGDPSYHFLLRRPWIHLHQCIPSTLHQCIKSNWQEKEIEIPGVLAPFEASESHLINASLFDELAPPGSGLIGSEQQVSLRQGEVFHPTTATERP